MERGYKSLVLTPPSHLVVVEDTSRDLTQLGREIESLGGICTICSAM